MHRIKIYPIIIALFTILLLVACGLISPLTPEESCLQISAELVDMNNDEVFDWPINVTDTIPITTDPVLCKGKAVFQDGASYYIQFYENSNEIAFEMLLPQTCEELADQVILMGLTESGWPVKLENLNRIDGGVGELFSCKAKAEFAEGEKFYLVISQDQENVFFEDYIFQTCEELAEQVILKGSTESGWPVKLENLKEIDGEVGELLTCKAEDQESEPIAIFQQTDKRVGLRGLLISELECDDIINVVMEFSEEMSIKSSMKYQEILKIYDPEEVSMTDDRLTCRGMALFQVGEDSMIQFHIEEDKDEDRFISYEKVD